MAQAGGFGRAVIWGALLGLVVVVVVVAVVVFGGTDFLSDAEPPSELLITSVVADADGVETAGVVFLLESDVSVTPIDTMTEVAIPGTSYNRLADAYSFGGGRAVAAAYGEAENAPAPAWVLLPADAWGTIVDDAGGALVDMPVEANVFLGDGLFVIESGPHQRTSDELRAILAWANADGTGKGSAVRHEIGKGVADVLLGEWEALLLAVASEDAQSSLSADTLEAFGAGAGIAP